MAVNYLASVPKLRGRENYSDWAFAIENLLVLDGLKGCISGSEQDGEKIGKAKAKLVLSIEASLYVHIKAATTAKEVWDKLKAMFDDSGFTRKIGLLRTLISMRLENCDSMSSYVNQTIEMAQKLQGTGFSIDEEWIGSLLLAGLTERYSPMIMAIEHSGIKVSTDVIKTKLLDMEPCGNVSNTGSALASKSVGKQNRFATTESGSQHSGAKKNIRCYRCKQIGHYKNRCQNAYVENKGEKAKQATPNAFSAVFLSGQFSKNDWYVDSGASVHLTANEGWIKNKLFRNKLTEIIVANENKISVLCSGEVEVTTVVGKKRHNVNIRNTLCVPELTTNLLSVSQLIKNGNSVKFHANGCKIYNRNNELVATADLIKQVYRLNVESSRCESIFVSAEAATSEVWHRRYGHVNYQDLMKLKNGIVNGITCRDGNPKKNCVVCCEGKQSRLPFQHKGTRSSKLLDIIHTDVCGPMDTKSIGGSKYFVLFEDDYSRMVFVYFLKSKDEVMDRFKEFKSMVENQKVFKIKKLRSDNGGEFCSNEMEMFLKRNGIIHQKTNPYTPEQNGLSERMNRTIVEKARCLLFEANLETKFWAEAVNTAVYLRNRSIASGLQERTPYEVWNEQKPDVSNLRVFGSPVMVHVPSEKRTKWDKKAVKMVLVGFSETTKGYRLYNPDNNKIITSRDVRIMEDNRQDRDELDVMINTGTENEEKLVSVGDKRDGETKDFLSCPKKSDNAPKEEVRSTTEGVRRSERNQKLKSFEDYVTYVCLDNNVKSEYDPVTVKEALSGSDGENWKKAMLDELKSFEENDAWELTELPKGGTIVDCKWVFKRKRDSGNKVSYRARLVARGFTQRLGVDYDETFSPVVRHSTLRLLFALAVKLNLEVTHLDVTTAFLNGNLDEMVYMRQPEGFVNNADKVCRLKKAIYGLKQSSRAWNKRVDEVIIELGYSKSKLEPCVYTKYRDRELIIIALYVDDFFVFSNSLSETVFLKQQLSSNFKIKDLGEAKQCLGMRICRNRKEGYISLDQEDYVNQLLKRFNMMDCKTANTPIETNLQMDSSNEVCDTQFPYQQLMGSLMYLSVLTRPDIAFSVSYLSQFNNCYNESHWKYAKRVLRYLQGTKNYGLRFEQSGSDVKGFADADWASDRIDRRSYTGFVFTLANAAISWQSRKQKTVALSSTEAEYMAISEAAKEAIYLRNVLYELTGIQSSIPLYNDNQGAKRLSENPVFHGRSKHIDVRYHFIRDTVNDGSIEILYLPTSDMPADMLTKGLAQAKQVKFVNNVGLVNTNL